MMKLLALAIATATLALVGALPAKAQLRIEITSGVTDPIPIAIVPFNSGKMANTDSSVVSSPMPRIKS